MLIAFYSKTACRALSLTVAGGERREGEMAQRSKFRADQGTKKLWKPQEGHEVVRVLLPLPK